MFQFVKEDNFERRTGRQQRAGYPLKRTLFARASAGAAGISWSNSTLPIINLNLLSSD